MIKYEYLKDSSFLKDFSLNRLKQQYVKITVLDWDENPIQDIVGIATGGSINLDGSSAIRRTANVSLYASNSENRITNPNYLLSINKKVSLEIGFKNNTSYYKNYDIIWFPMGVYVIVQPSISHNSSGISISLQLKDKMCLLNGECGGTFPASVTFSEVETVDDKGKKIILKPTIYQIIQELVNHWGGEPLAKIIISDIDSRIKKVMKWTGTTPVYIFNRGDGYEFTTNENLITSLITTDNYQETTNFAEVNKEENYYIKYINGQDVGYIYTDFYYPSEELVGKAGGNVCEILENIKNILGNYEYFYDLEGNFIFREIKNYLNKTEAMIALEELDNNSYLIDLSKGKSIYNFDNSALITSYSNNPQYSMIKNDFIVWGQRKNASGGAYPIRYHLAIDDKPNVDIVHNVFQYEDPEDGLTKAKSTIDFDFEEDLPEQGVTGAFYLVYGTSYIYTENRKKIYDKNNKQVSFKNVDGNIYQWDAFYNIYDKIEGGKIVKVTSKDWRTELYLQGVDAEPFGVDSNYYYTELQNEWPKLYNIWGDNPGFYKEVLATPSNCDYFLDFIDSSAAIGEFSISNIGRRTKILEDNKVNCLFAPDIPDLVIIKEGTQTTEYERQECEDRGQRYTQVGANIYSCLSGGGGLYSAYDAVRELLYQYTSYNESISLQCIPIYHLDVNTRISVLDDNSDIGGDYVIKTMTIPLDINSTSSISAIRALERF